MIGLERMDDVKISDVPLLEYMSLLVDVVRGGRRKRVV